MTIQICGKSVFALLGALLVFAGTAEKAWVAEADFVITDFLDRDWTNELVRFPLTPEQLKSVQANQALLGPDGSATPYQVLPATTDRPAKIAFQANLKPFGKSTYRFGAGTPNLQTDLKIEDTPEALRLTNGRTGIALRKQLQDQQGPIAAIRLASGKWVGGSLLRTKLKATSYSAEVIARGPVYLEAVCKAEFAGGHLWELRCRLEAHEPVVIFEEKFALGDDSIFELTLNDEWTPTQVLFRSGVKRGGPLMSEKIPEGAEPVFWLEPWLRWWMNDRQGNWFGIYDQGSPELLSVGACNPAFWVDPDKIEHSAHHVTGRREGVDIFSDEVWAKKNALVFVRNDQNKLRVEFPLKDGARRWMLSALDKTPSLAALDPNNKEAFEQVPPPHQYLIKHGDFPLDMVKDYVLQWPGEEGMHPGLLVTQQQAAKFLAASNSPAATPEQLRAQADAALAAIQGAVNLLVKQPPSVKQTIGCAPHHQYAILDCLRRDDAFWPTLTAPQRERLKAQIAFLGYTVNRDDYWSPERDLHANPNMTTMVAGYQAAIAGALPSHPQSREWMKRGMRELKEVELDHWSDANGGWLEAPHYALVSYDNLVGMFSLAYNGGFNDYLYDPKMKLVAEWFAKISTPPDSRVGGRRHLPALGNTYLFEGAGAHFGVLAGIWKDKDPQFAGRMQWMHLRHGSTAGEAGNVGQSKELLDPAIVPIAPNYQSELFPETGVILRHHFPTDRETQLSLIAGNNHDHYDQDSGSITLWGKGRIVADDFGYGGYLPPYEQSMVALAGSDVPALMHVKDFTAGARLDFVRAENDDWRRQIAFVKDDDPLAANYFVLRDDVLATKDATWRLWLTAAEVNPHERGAKVVGLEDVDTEVFYVTPQQVSSTVENMKRECWGNEADGTFVRMSRSQLGLVVPLQTKTSLTTVIFPRLKTEKPPTFATIADGNGVKVESAAGTDYVFLANEPIVFVENDLRFEGTVGTVQIRAGKPNLSLGAPGKIAAGGQVLQR